MKKQEYKAQKNRKNSIENLRKENTGIWNYSQPIFIPNRKKFKRK